MKPWLGLFPLLMLSSCAAEQAQPEAIALPRMIGMSDEQVYACMGTPDHTDHFGSRQTWSYTSSNGRRNGSTMGNASSYGNFMVGGFGESGLCKVDIVMREGKVTAVNYHGPAGTLLRKGEPCALAIQNCITPSGAQPAAEH